MAQVKEAKEQKTRPEKRDDSASRIQAEIAAIRKRCEVKCVVDIGDIKVKGHKRKLDVHEEEDDEKLAKHKGVDSDDEDNTKRIFLSQVRVSRQAKDSGYDSEHSYKYVIGGK